MLRQRFCPPLQQAGVEHEILLLRLKVGPSRCCHCSFPCWKPPRGPGGVGSRGLSNGRSVHVRVVRVGRWQQVRLVAVGAVVERGAQPGLAPACPPSHPPTHASATQVHKSAAAIGEAVCGKAVDLGADMVVIVSHGAGMLADFGSVARCAGQGLGGRGYAELRCPGAGGGGLAVVGRGRERERELAAGLH